MVKVEINKIPASILVAKEPTSASGCCFSRFYIDENNIPLGIYDKRIVNSKLVKCLLNQSNLGTQDNPVELGDCWLEKYGKCPYLFDINLNKE